MDEFSVRIRRIANLLNFEQDTSGYDSLEVAAAKIYLKDQLQEQDNSEIQDPDEY